MPGVLDNRTAAIVSSCRLRCLVAITSQGNLDALHIGFIGGFGATKLPLALLAHAGSQMARAGGAVHDLTFGRQAKSLLGAFMGFLLGHVTHSNKQRYSYGSPVF
jgi:hypothetical protein